MKCPHCGYKTGYDWEKLSDNYPEMAPAEKGEFFAIKDALERKSETHPNYFESKTLYACPDCGKTFIEV